MQWYSAKKYKPVDKDCVIGVCEDGGGTTSLYLCSWDSQLEAWNLVDVSKDESKNDKLSDIDFKIHYFAIPDPIPLEES